MPSEPRGARCPGADAISILCCPVWVLGTGHAQSFAGILPSRPSSALVPLPTYITESLGLPPELGWLQAAMAECQYNSKLFLRFFYQFSILLCIFFKATVFK